MPEARGATGFSRTIDEILSPNSLKVLQKRYLTKDPDGNALELPSDMFARVATNIAQAEWFGVRTRRRFARWHRTSTT
jgi:ribonucleotide reductase alpha subunit